LSPQKEAAGDQATEALRDAIRAGRQDVRLLVPTATLAEHRRHQLAREGLVFSPELVQTFSRYVAALVPEIQQVSDPLFELIAERALEEVNPAEFERVRDAPGFPASAAAAIRRLDAVGLTPRELARICGRYMYAVPLARVWERVEEKLAARGLRLRAGVLRAAAQATRPAGTLLLNGFAKLSALERAVLREAAATNGEGAPETCTSEKFSADSEVREAEEIARRILELYRAGTPFREMGVALRNPERYVAVVRPVLERFGIPARFYFSEPLTANAGVRFFAGTVEAFLSGWDHERCLPALRLAPGLAGDSLDRFDFAVQAKIPNTGLAALRELAGQQRRLAQFLENWEVLDRNWQRRATPAQWAVRLAADLRNIYRLDPLADQQSAATVAWERARAAGLALFESALLETAADWPEDAAPVSLAQFWERARTVVKHTALRVPDRRRNVVHVMSVYEARQWSLDTIFIPGLAEKAFPKRHSEDAFLPDAAMETLKQAGFGVDTSADLDREEETLFAMVRQSARRSVVLSFAVEQKNGPSPFWDTADEAKVATVSPVRPAVRVRAAPRRPTPRIADTSLLAWMAVKRPAFSVTELENYLGCPFKYFALNFLRLKTRPARPEKRLNFLEEGNIVHKVLEEWLPERPAIAPIFQRVFAEHCAALRVRHGYRTEVAYAKMLADVERFAQSTVWPRHEACAVEKKMTFQVADGITINARVDRIERLADGRLVIIDYKYSNAKNTKDKSEDPTRLQGPLYVRGIAQDGEVVAAMVYFSLKKTAEAFGWGVVPGLARPLQDLTPEWVDKGVAETRVAVNQIREGVIPVRPASEAVCKWCEAKDACRVEVATAMTVGGN
jgi:RecB family exonuclease